MDYEFSFDRKSGIALLACILLLCGLIAMAGFLAGSRYKCVTGATSVMPVVSPSRSTAAQTTVPAPVVRSPAVPSPTVSADSTETVKTAGESTSAPVYVLQFGVFEEKDHAEALVKRLKGESVKAEVSAQQNSAGTRVYVVRGDSYLTMQAASSAAQGIHAQTGEVAFIRRRDAPE